MPAELGGGLGTVATLVVGAAGALAAIFLKESVQAAMQRRMIAWQLLGYLMSWRSQIARHGSVVSIYEKVKERNLALTNAMLRGSSEFQSLHAQQYQERSELREKIKATLVEAIAKAEGKDLGNVLDAALLAESAASFAEQRKMLADSKSFISDRDAAALGKAPAMNVIQFRTSLLYLMMALEAIVKMAHIQSNQRPQIVAGLVDSIIVYGEDMLVAMIRLERNVEIISKKSILDLTFDILRGR